jgi:mRNA-degrading endonuclease RelE of RelBE toxin-antitoxin system
MTLKFFITPELGKTLYKLARKDRALAIAVRKKITQIISNDIIFVEHFKNLRGDLFNYKRVHVGNFVLMFKVEGDAIIFDKFRHHDRAY